MNRKEMNPSGRPGRSFGAGNGNGYPVRKEVSWVTRVSQKGARQDGNEKLLGFKKGEIWIPPFWHRNLGSDKPLFIDELNAGTAFPTRKAVEKMLQLQMELPSDYEECGVCGYDHQYASSDSAALDHIHSRHIESFFKKV